jgi:hypothetical protein
MHEEMCVRIMIICQALSVLSCMVEQYLRLRVELHPDVCARLIHEVNGLVWQEAPSDVPWRVNKKVSIKHVPSP